MSDNIPFEMQVEIIKRFPVKSLLQFRSVSKTWKALIDSPQFITSYSGPQQHLLIRYENVNVHHHKYQLILDDDTFLQHGVSPPLPPLVNMLKRSRIIGTSHGLLCLFGRSVSSNIYTRRVVFAILWNISIRKAVAVVVPNVKGSMMMEYETVLGFGVCRETTDPKIVKIIQINSWSNMENISSIPKQVEVFTLSTPVWRSPVSNLPRVSIRFGYSKVAIDGVLYWLATDRITIGGGGFRLCNLIVSFDMTNEEFKEISLPDSLANQPYYNLSIFKRRESLVVIERGVEEDTAVFYVWMMEDGVSKMFTKLFTINVKTPDATVNGFKRSGEPIIELGEDLGANGTQPLFSVHPYVETLHLFDQQDGTVYNGT